jgi:hypothetical protein
MWKGVVAALLVLGALAPAARADGEFIINGGTYYRIIGGAALRVGSCAPLGGCPGATAGNPGSYRATPVDGTFMGIANGNAIARIAGGVPFAVADCAPVENCAGRIDLDADGFAAYGASHRDLPDAAYVRKADGDSAGLIARAVGGVLFGFSSCANLNSCQGFVNVQTAGWEAYVATHRLAADGTFVHVANGALQMLVARAVGGALVHLTTCDPFNACAGLVSVDETSYKSYAAAHPNIADGAFVRVADGVAAGSFLRAAGGRLIAVSDCGGLGGCDGAVGLDQGAVNEYQNVHPFPADGTVVRGVPSGSVFTFRAGILTPGGDAARAVALNDASLAQFARSDRVDRDGDGTLAGADCDDGNPAIRPGASDPPGDRIDQDCSGADAAYPRLTLRIGGYFVRGKRTRFTRLYVRDVPAGSVVTLACRGKSCPFKTRRVIVKRATRVLSLVSRFKGKRLRAGVRVELTVTHPATVGTVVRWTMRSGADPRRTELCLPPGARSAVRCPAGV